MRETRVNQSNYGNIFSRLVEIESLRSVRLPLVLFTTAGLLWLISLPNVDPGGMNDLGLVSVLPVTFFISLALLAISFTILLHQGARHERFLLLHVLLLILILHGTPHIVYGTLRYSWAWKHLGIVDYIQRHGSVNPSIFNLNAYHNWPGFFALAAFFNQVAGLPDSMSYAGWGPVILNLLGLGALLFIYKTLTLDRRVIWLGVFFYFFFSWIGQDYFSPQAFAFFLFLVTFAIILKFFRRNQLSSKVDTPKYLRDRLIGRLYARITASSLTDKQGIHPTTATQRLGLMVILIFIFASIASSHQLTPVMMLSGLALLVLFQITNQRYTPFLMAVITTAWVIFMAVGFLNGNVDWIIRSIGSLLDNVNDTLIDLNTASPGQQLVARIDRILSVSAWVLGLFGIYRRYRSGHWDLPALLLAFAPLPILVMNAYGGEMLFRVYLFSLPFISFFAAGSFYPSEKAGRSVFTPIFVILISFLLIPGFIYSYYGKDRMYYFSPNEVAAAQFVYTIAPQGSLVVDSTWNWPRQAVHYEYYNYLSLIRLPEEKRTEILQDPAGSLYNLMGEAAPEAVNLYGSESGSQPEALPDVAGESGLVLYPASYFIVTRSQMAETQMAGSLPADWFTRIKDALSGSPNFRIVYENADATVYELVHP
jgi:hypothetical protein